MQEVFVHGLLGGARHGRLLCDQRAVGIEAARSVAPAVVDVAAFVPIPCDGVPVEPIAPADLAEVRLQPELPVHVQLAHDVLLFQSCSFLPVLLGGKSISTLVRLAKVRWRGWRNCIGAVGIMRCGTFMFCSKGDVSELICRSCSSQLNTSLALFQIASLTGLGRIFFLHELPSQNRAFF